MTWPKEDAQRVFGGRIRPYPRPEAWKRIVHPAQNPEPPRPRPIIFFYVFTLLYSQSGFTRKFRHLLPCQHNVTYFAISEQSKRHLYALGSECKICAFCEETVVSHSHLSIFQCPCNSTCPRSSKIPPHHIDAKIQHFCGHHQQTVPHPLDLNAITNLPVPMGAPSQFSFHSSFPMDSMVVALALQDRQGNNNPPGASPISNCDVGTMNMNRPPVNIMGPPRYPPPPPRVVPHCTCPPTTRNADCPANRTPTPFPGNEQRFRSTRPPPPSPQERSENSEVELEIAVDE